MLPEPLTASFRNVIAPATISGPSAARAAGMWSTSPVTSVRGGAEIRVRPDRIGNSKLESAATTTGSLVSASVAINPEALRISSKVPVGAAASKSSRNARVSRSPGSTATPESPSAMMLPVAGGSASEATSTPFHSTCMRSMGGPGATGLLLSSTQRTTKLSSRTAAVGGRSGCRNTAVSASTLAAPTPTAGGICGIPSTAIESAGCSTVIQGPCTAAG